jgi:serine/threonine protein kinase
LLSDPPEPTDDSPTVITKATPPAGAIKTEDQFAGGLRGRRLAHFELIEPIGVGGMAAVLRARDTQLDRQVALKILPPEMASDAENVRRFHQEARSAARLDHENIARVFFCGEDQRLHFIAFEFVEGENLRTILERRGRLPVGEALNYMLQVAAGLAHAASRGVVHRDIKPSNIIITPNGRAKLVDMGLARSLEPQHDMGLTQSGVTLGTFDYISPEQALEPRDADVRSDIYSLGCTFYHMLTGQPPVPEGTAAKKLHHHQHVKPGDPRQLVPNLPDEVAVILDRMMAKQPKDRYQTPEHLVHHLLMAARKLGVAGEAPEGVLAVEAALPNAPTGRPLILAVLAGVAVVALIFFIDQSSGPKEEPSSGPPLVKSSDKRKGPADGGTSTSATPTASENNLKQPIKPLPREPNTPVFNADHPTETELFDFVQQHRREPAIIIELADDLDLRGDTGRDLILANDRVTIRPRHDAKKRPTIYYDYRAIPAQALQAPLTIDSKDCTIEGLRFVLNQNGASVPMTALWFRFRSPGLARVRRCEFVQANPSLNEKNRLTSVLAQSSDSATLQLSESCFLGFASLQTAGGGQGTPVFSGASSGGQDAVARRGPVRLEATNCAFGPHAATFRLEGDIPESEGLVRLTHCSVQAANQSAVFDLTDGTGARIEASFSLFSHLGDPGMVGMPEGRGAVLLRRASAQGEVVYHGHENRYHNLDGYLAVTGATDETVQRLLDEVRKDDDSRELETSPWKDAQPLVQLEQLAVRAAFQVNPLAPELRLPARESAKGQLIGAEKIEAFSYLDGLPPLKDGRRELIVEKRPKVDEAARRYPSLHHALLDAQPGDRILLRLDGEVRLDPLALDGAKLGDLTIRAAGGFHPVLTLGDTQEADAVLFRVYNGKLRLEELELRLRPSRDATSQAVVSFLGDGECTFKDCLITLDRSGRTTPLMVAVLNEPGRLMRKPDATADQKPRIGLENCVVRGQGDLIWSQGGQPAELALKNSLIALTGSLLSVEGNKDMPPPMSALSVRLQRVTTYLGGNLLRLKAAKDLKSVAQIQCTPEECLFLPGAGDRVLIHLEGPESEERGLKGKVSWETGKNAYGNFTTLLEQQTIGAMMQMPLPSNLEAWKTSFSGEMDSEYNIKLPAASDAAALPQLLPSAFRIPEALKDYGADLTALRNLAPLRGKTEPAKPPVDLSPFDFD